MRSIEKGKLGRWKARPAFILAPTTAHPTIDSLKGPRTLFALSLTGAETVRVYIPDQSSKGRRRGCTPINQLRTLPLTLSPHLVPLIQSSSRRATTTARWLPVRASANLSPFTLPRRFPLSLDLTCISPQLPASSHHESNLGPQNSDTLVIRAFLLAFQLPPARTPPLSQQSKSHRRYRRSSA